MLKEQVKSEKAPRAKKAASKTKMETAPLPKPVEQRPTHTIGPDGAPISLEDAPPPYSPDTGDIRWTARRKATVVCLINGGVITQTEGMERWAMSLSEMQEIMDHYKRHGLPGLRTTKVQDYREND